MKINSTPIKLATLFGLLVLLIFINPAKLAQAIEIRQEQVSDNILSTEEVTAKLQLADQNKQTNPTLFNKYMAEVSKQPTFTTEQQYLFHFLEAYNSLYVGHYDKAKNKFEVLLLSGANNLIKFRINYLLIYIATATKNWQDGLQYVNTNLELLPTISKGEPHQNGMLASIMFYSQMGQYKLALSHIEKLSKEKLSVKNNCLLSQLSLEAKFNLKNLKLTNGAIELTIDDCFNADFKVVSNLVRTLKAKLFLQQQMPEKALNLLLGSLEEVRSTNYPMLIAEISNIIAKAYWQTNDIYNAKAYATKSLENNPENANLLQSVDSYYLLYQIAKKQKNLAIALEYFEKYSEINKINLEGQKAKSVAFQVAKNKNLVQQNEIDLLNEKNNSLAAEQALVDTKVHNRHLLLLLLSFVIVSLTLFGLRLWRDHKRVKELAEYDPLTGIFNRGHFTQVAPSALKYCQNAQQDLCVIIFDLDHFKKVNDSFGHACGDWALKATTKACESIGRKNDIFARLGGEEFCIILPSCNIDTAMIRAEDCRAAIEAIITEASGCDFTITASFGVTDIKRSGYNLEQLMADADIAAYASKHAGRNRVTMFTVPVKTETEKLDTSWGYN